MADAVRGAGAPTPGHLLRVISQAGDSTDGEDYEEEDDDVQFDTLKKEYSQYHSSCVLKDLGNKILQSGEVREKYKRIKATFTENLSEEEKNKLFSFDQAIGRGWGLVLSESDKDTTELSENGALRYFQTNSDLIERSLRGQEAQQSETEKANCYLQTKVKLWDKLNEIYKLNRAIETRSQENRNNMELLEFSEIEDDHKDASLYLAKVKVSKKLEKDFIKNSLYRYKFGSFTPVKEYVIACRKENGETWNVGTRGGLRNSIYTAGTYEEIGERTDKFIKTFFDGETKAFNDFLKNSFRGIKVSKNINLLKDKEHKPFWTYFKLIFGVEVKRNSAALLTNAMFFDLATSDLEEYTVGNIHTKLPMAMAGAVSGSVEIDKTMKSKWVGKLTSDYDYRKSENHENAIDLAKRDEELLQAWLKWKIGKEEVVKYVEAKLFYDLIEDWYGIKIPCLGPNVSDRILVYNPGNVP